MMEIRYHKRFLKHYQKLNDDLKRRVSTKLSLFFEDPLDKTLKNHALAGELAGKRALSVTGDVRIIFEENDGYAFVLFLDVGTHNQVY